MQREIDEMKALIRGLERAVVDLRQGENCGSSDLTTQQVLALTREIFPCGVRVYDAEDPEIPGDCYQVFEVTAEGPADEVLTRDEQWHRRLCQLPDRIPGRYRLSIVMDAHDKLQWCLAQVRAQSDFAETRAAIRQYASSTLRLTVRETD